jgi:hypothetical protein
LWNPETPPQQYPPPRPKPTVYNETWALDARNTVIAAVND